MRRNQLELFLKLNKCKDSLGAEFSAYKGKKKLDLALMNLDGLAGSVRIAPCYEANVADTCRQVHDACHAAVQQYDSEFALVNACAMHLLQTANASFKPWFQLYFRFVGAKKRVESALRLVGRVSGVIQKHIDGVYSGLRPEDRAAASAASPSAR